MTKDAKPEALIGRLLRKLWRLTAVGFAIIVVLLALAIGLFRVLVPMVPDYHARIEAAASKALGFDIHFERIDARWRWRGPELVFVGATVVDENTGEPLMNADSGYVNLNVGAFLGSRAVVPDSVLLRGLELVVRRDKDGAFEVFGRRAGNAPVVASHMQYWPVPSGRFELRDAEVVYIDGDNEPLRIPNVELNLDIVGERVRLDGRLSPPGSMGEVLEVSAELDGSPADRENLRWQVYLAGSDLDLSALSRLFEAHAPAISSGRGDMVFWAAVRGARPEHASLDLDVTALRFNGAGGDQPYKRIRGRLEWDETTDGWLGRAHGLLIERNGNAWPDVDARLEMTERTGGARKFEFASAFIRVEDLSPFARWLPESLGRDLVVGLEPSGTLHDVTLEASVADGRVLDYALNGRFFRLGWRGLEARPGVQGLSGSLRADERGGRLELDSESVAVQAPRLLREQLDAWRLAGAVLWRKANDSWQIISDKLLLATGDFDALGRFTVTRTSEAAPEVDVNIELGDLDLARARAYLPVPIMKPKLVAWLDMALEAGTIRSGNVKLRGPLDKFPFDDDSGEFVGVVNIEDMRMKHSKDWPPVEDVNATITFSGRSLDGQVRSAALHGLTLGESQVGIANLAVPVLTVATRARADLIDLKNYFVITPAAKKYADLLSLVRPDGQGDARFTLKMPIKEWQTFDYNFDLTLDGATVAYADWPFELEAVRGQLAFSRDNLESRNLAALLLGRPVDIAVHSQALDLVDAGGAAVAVNAVVADLSGRADASVLGERLYAPFGDFFQGTSEWSAQVRFPPFGYRRQSPLEISFYTQLDGMSVRLPAPLAKPASAPRILNARARFATANDSQIELNYGSDVKAAIEMQRTSGTWGVRRGQVALGGGAATLGERPGLSIVGALPQLDYDAWRAALAGASTAGEGPKLNSVLRTANLKLTEFRVLGQTLSNASVTLDRNVREWLIEIDSTQASGAIFFPFDHRKGSPVIANLQRVNWRSGNSNDSVDPRGWPAMRVDVQDFVFDDKHFGVLNLVLDPVEDGLAISRFVTTDPSFTTSATGAWRYIGGAPSRFTMELKSNDAMTTLERLNSVGAIDADSADIGLDLSWDGGPLGNLLSEIYGTVSIRVGDGQLLNVDPKAGRVFGLLSITALPRRLSLDFRDVFNKGFAFDAIEGDFTIRDGSAHTDNLLLRGPAAQVGIVGRAGIVARDYDQTAVVYANVGSTLPIAGTIAGGPAVGAALLLFSEIFKDPLKQIGRVNYHITGSWDDPQVARVAQRPAAAPPADSPPAEVSQEDPPRG